MTKSLHVTIPDWMMEEIIGTPDNKSQRVQELLQKGSMVETLEEATGKSLREMVSSDPHKTKRNGRGPTGANIPLSGSTLRKINQGHMDVSTSPTYNRQALKQY